MCPIVPVIPCYDTKPLSFNPHPLTHSLLLLLCLSILSLYFPCIFPFLFSFSLCALIHTNPELSTCNTIDSHLRVEVIIELKSSFLLISCNPPILSPVFSPSLTAPTDSGTCKTDNDIRISYLKCLFQFTYSFSFFLCYLVNHGNRHHLHRTDI